MASIIIVSGCPGSGKTTLARSLALSSPQGLHLVSDLYYSFPVARVDPTRPESHHQNTVVMRAVARSARAFAEGGYNVFVDGVIGPWFLPVFRDELSEARVSYLVLRARESDVLGRVREREGPGRSPIVRHMFAAFADLGEWGVHGIETSDRAPDDVLAVALHGLALGQYVVRW